MKLFILFLLAATCSAQIYYGLEEVAEEAVASFVHGMNDAEPLAEALGRTYTEGLGQVEDDIKQELGKNLELVIVQVVDNVKISTDRNYALHSELTKEVTAFILQVQEEVAHLHDRPEEKHEVVKSRVQDFKQILANKVREIRHGLTETLVHLSKFNLHNLVESTKNQVIEKLNFHAISNYLKNVLGEAHEFATSILAAIFEKGKHLIQSIVNHFLPSPSSSKALAVTKRWAISIKSAACFLVGLITRGYGVEYIVEWIKTKVPENWKGKLLDIVAHGGKFVLKWATKSLCLAASPARSSVIFNLIHKMRGLLEDLGLVAQNDFFRFADWVRTVWNSGLEKAAGKFESLQKKAHEIHDELHGVALEGLTGLGQLFEIYRNVFGEHTDELLKTIHDILQKA